MLVQGQPFRTVWMAQGKSSPTLAVIDQRKLPFSFELLELASVAEVVWAIKEMVVRGAGCIGATAGYGMILAAQESGGDEFKLRSLAATLAASRPTAVNLSWAVSKQLVALLDSSAKEWVNVASTVAEAIANEDVAACQAIGSHGLEMIRVLRQQQGKGPLEPTNFLTHCNAGWLAFVDIGSATAPIYAAHDAGIPVHVWVDETRPRNQGARLTAWELAAHGVPHTVIADNAGGHLMQHGMVDIVITGADRVTRCGDAANKIGTYLKALAAKDCGVPFYVALPSSTFDWTLRDGVREIPIEERTGEEMSHVLGVIDGETTERSLRIVNPNSAVGNPAFDVTPGRCITGLITERGICPATEAGIGQLFPER